jgi:hypothetical protein
LLVEVGSEETLHLKMLNQLFGQTNAAMQETLLNKYYFKVSNQCFHLTL